MNNTVLKAPTSLMKNFDELFIELSVKACNLKCKHCYIDFSNSKNTKNFIPRSAITEYGAKVQNYSEIRKFFCKNRSRK